MAFGAIALAEYIHRVAARYPINVAIHTDHCSADKVDKFMRPLLAETRRRRAAGQPNLFSSHMFDGSELPLAQNMKIAQELLRECAELEIILEVEAGVVGGEEDGVNHEGAPAEKLYTTPEDMVGVAARSARGQGRPLHVRGDLRQRARRVQAGQRQAQADDPARRSGRGGGQARRGALRPGVPRRLGLGAGEIHETLEYGVVKMNVDTDTQYAYTRPIADHMFKNYDGVLKVDGEVGNKKHYDPRSYLKAAEKGMQARVEAGLRRPPLDGHDPARAGSRR
jgi:fructose-bisphosphate aldolase class II